MNNTIHIHLKRPRRPRTTLCQSDINQNPLTRIHYSYPDTYPIIYIKTPHCLQQLCSNSFTLSICHIPYQPIVSEAYRIVSEARSHMPKPIRKNLQTSKKHLSHSLKSFSHTCHVADDPCFDLLCLKSYYFSPIAHSVPALTFFISIQHTNQIQQSNTALVTTFILVTPPFEQGQYTRTTPVHIGIQ